MIQYQLYPATSRTDTDSATVIAYCETCILKPVFHEIDRGVPTPDMIYKLPAFVIWKCNFQSHVAVTDFTVGTLLFE